MVMLVRLVAVLNLAAAPNSTPDAAGRAPTTFEAVFASASKLYAAGQHAKAVVLFEDAYRLKPHANVMFNIAKCYEKLDVFSRALKAYREYLRLEPNPPDKQSVKDAIANLERRLRQSGVQQITLFAEPKEARIELDGKDAGPSPATVELAAGVHTLKVSARGFEPEIRSFEVTLAHASEITVTLEAAEADGEPAPEPGKPPKPDDDGPAPYLPPPAVRGEGQGLRTAAWALLGGGLAVAAAGGVLVGLAHADAAKLTTGPGPISSQQADATVREGQLLQALGWTGLIVGVVTAATGGVMAAVSHQPTVVGFVAPDGTMGLGISGRLP
jgi:tetratricopeptide (TPR) repeat protein